MQAPTWLLDSSASHHVTSSTAHDGPYVIIIGIGKGLRITHTGSTPLPSPFVTQFHLNDVLCVPSIHKDLISIAKFNKQNHTSIELFPDFFLVKDLSTGAALLRGPNKDYTYEWSSSLPSSRPLPQAMVSMVPPTPISSIVGLVNHRTFLQILHSSSVAMPSDPTVCTSCHCNKSHRLSFGTSSLVSKGLSDLLYNDVWGPAPYSSIDGFSSYIIFVDHFTKFIWLYPMKCKSDVFYIFTNFKALVENYFKTKIITLDSDESGEFIKLKSFLATHGITHLITPSHTSEHNGIAERRHRHVVEIGLTILHQASLPLPYWSYAYKAAVYFINRMPTLVLHNISPFKALFGDDPNYTKLRVFGCLCFLWLRPYNSNKLIP